MMLPTNSLLLAVSWVSAAVAAPAAPAAPQLGPLELFHELPQLPPRWTSHGRADGKTTVLAQIGLRQSNVTGLQAKLLDISNPESANYGKWLTKEEVDAWTAPPAENVKAVRDWLAAHGVGADHVRQPTSDWLEFTAPLSTMEALLGAEYEWMAHADDGGGGGARVPATTRYSLPRSLHSVIDLVAPTTALYANKRPTVIPANATTDGNGTTAGRAGCNTDAITPSCIRSLYNVDYTSRGRATAASTLFIDVAASHSDYRAFGSRYAPGGRLADFRDVSVAGGRNPGGGNQNTLLEGNLDTQYIGGLSSPNPSELLAAGPNGQDFSDQMANFASFLTSANDPPSTVSTSYGGEERFFGGSYMDRVCNDFMKAGARGISVFFSSGDHGVGGNGGSSCNNGLIALWPAVCPWSTAVGGTQFSAGGEEVAAQFPSIRGSTGGGFSTHFRTPAYQADDVAAYERGPAGASGGGGGGAFDKNGRGYPDVSLVSLNYQVVVGGRTLSVLGTSASSPAWAALVSVLNDARASGGGGGGGNGSAGGGGSAGGRSNLGFLNPLLYSARGKAALRDITSGSNPGCGRRGFSATRGWDPASGLGVMDFAKLRAAV